MINLLTHEDFVQSFLLHQSTVRGRFARLGPVLNAILDRHENPPEAQRLLGEMLTLAALLSSSLPPQGILTLQAKGEGPIRLLVVDAEPEGKLRGYVELAEGGAAQLAALTRNRRTLDLPALMGQGYVMLTLDLGMGEPYQGIVPLEGANLSEALTHYFTHSQQIDVRFKIAVQRRTQADMAAWEAGGMMLERIPEEGGKAVDVIDDDTHGWEYNALLVNTLTTEELLDPHLSSQALLYRLFNENGVWVQDPRPVEAHCRCDRQKIASVLTSMGKETLLEIMTDHQITVNCQFCNKAEVFSPEDLGLDRRGVTTHIMPILTEVTFGSSDFYRAVALRVQVLREPIGLWMPPEQLLDQASHRHYVLKQQQQVIATAMLVRLSPETVRIRQVVVSPEYQGRGIGMQLLEHMHEHATSQGYQRAELHARIEAQGFYARLGYEAIGEPFIEVTLPHIRMMRAL